MDIQIRDLRDGELRSLLDTVELAFGEELTDAMFAASARIFEPERVLVAADGDRIVGGGAAFSFRLTVPGGEVGSAGVTAVGVLPSHRRRGILTSLMRRQLEDVRRAGEPTAILWASEGSIYQRFGYGLATLHGTIEVTSARSAFRGPHERAGEFRFLTPDEARVELPRVYEPLRRAIPGFFTRTTEWWDVETIEDPEWSRRGAGPKSLVLYEAGGEPEGYVVYRVRHGWEAGVSTSTLEVQELQAATPRALRDLWRFCFDHDLILNVKARFQPADHPLLLLLAEPRRLRLTLGDGLWLRIVDVQAALRARAYPVADRIILDLTDDFLPDLTGTWSLDTRTHDSVERTTDEADLALDVSDLGALYLGAFSATDLLRVGRTRELRPGAAARADAMFGWHRRPWSPQVF